MVIPRSARHIIAAKKFALSRLYRNIQWNSLMAAVIIAILPMLTILFFAQKFFVKGIQFSGMNR
jgi:ABC-type glycerol-3-phosphate transport system permease component